MLDPSLPPPTVGRTFGSRRRVRLADMDATGRLRLDAVARFLQDSAIDDVQETGWGMPEHLWFVRRIRVEVRAPFVDDREVGVVTWCSGLAAIAAGRRWSVVGDRGGRIEVDSVWIHLGPDQRPARIESFDVYEEATGGRPVSTRLELPVPPAEEGGRPWALRSTDVDLHGHVNNTAHWQAVEDALAQGLGPSPRGLLTAELDYHGPIDLTDALELAMLEEEKELRLAFRVGESLRAVARVAPAAPTAAVA